MLRSYDIRQSLAKYNSNSKLKIIYNNMYNKSNIGSNDIILALFLGSKGAINDLTKYCDTSNRIIVIDEYCQRLAYGIHFYKKGSHVKLMYNNIEVIYVFINTREELYTELDDMKFNKAITNPPYGDLHLEILARILTSCDVIVSLQPIRWLQDSLAIYKKSSDYNKYMNIISSKIEDIEVLNQAEVSEMFDAGINMGIGILTLSSKGGFDYTKFHNTLLYKIIDNPKFRGTKDKEIKVGKVTKPAYCLTVHIDGGHSERTSSKGSTYDFIRAEHNYGKYYINGVSTNGKTLKENKESIKRSTNGKIENWTCIQFDSEAEVINYYNFTKTKFFKYMYKEEMVDVNVHPAFLPWLGEAINPRTGKIGYSSDWTDEDLYKYFDLTPEEIKEIEKLFN